MLDQPEFERWREEAQRALELARLAARAQLFNWACFAGEQAAELAMKALLHGIGSGPWGNDLDRLRETAQHEGIAVSEDVEDALRRLGRHYIPARYPDAHAGGGAGRHYGEADWIQAERDVTLALAFVDDAWVQLS